MKDDLQHPIDDVNVLRYVRLGVQCWLKNSISPMNGPNFDTVPEVLEFIRENLTDVPLWTVYYGGVKQDGSEQVMPQVTLACRKPYSTSSRDRTGKRIAKGSIDEVWPVFEAYVRML